MTTIRVDVTAEDIAKGEPRQGESCALARAMTRACRQSIHVGCTSAEKYIWFTAHDPHQTALPDEADAFALAFDNGERVEPFSFEVEV